MFDVFSSFSPAILIFLSLVLLIAGAVRGFAGFGAGMIFMPVASSLISPPIAAASFLFIDGIVALPLIWRAVRICDWSTVLPAVLGAVTFVHIGAWMLATMDVLVLRWIIFGIVASLMALLISGWRFRSKPRRPVTFSVGATAGILGGISQVSAPPVAALWLSSVKEPAIVRANMIVFFALASIGTFIAYTLNGFFTIAVWHLLIVAIPSYAFGLYMGSKGFGTADPGVYRRVAYGLIGLAAVTSMPLLDGILR